MAIKRIRHTGRDFELYFLTPAGKPHTDKSLTAGLRKMVASTNCSFNSTATFETIVDKSTPKNGLKQLQKIDWGFSSDYNVADIGLVRELLNAHKAGLQVYVAISSVSNEQRSLEVPDKIDAIGTYDHISNDMPQQEENRNTVASGWCVISSIQINAQDGSLATFSMTLEGEGDYDTDADIGN